MKNLYTPEDLSNPISYETSLADTVAFYEQLESENVGVTNDGFNKVEDALDDITQPIEYSQDNANTFFSLGQER